MEGGSRRQQLASSNSTMLQVTEADDKCCWFNVLFRFDTIFRQHMNEVFAVVQRLNSLTRIQSFTSSAGKLSKVKC